MKGFVKFLHNVLWTFVLLGILGIVGGICYGFYDYYSGNTERYENLYREVLIRVTEVKNKITGEETETVEVSPIKKPEMGLSVAGTYFETGVVPWDNNGDAIIMCYGKDTGEDLYIPFGFGKLMNTSLYTGDQDQMEDISEYVMQDELTGTLIVSEVLLKTLEAGEYFIVPEVSNYQNEEEVWKNAIALIVEEQTTYRSNQQGFAGSGNNGMILNDLGNPREIVLPFYNLGDDRIIMLRELSSGMGNQNLALPVASESYKIIPEGNAVVLTKEYLQNRPEFAMQRFQAVLASGATLDTGWTYITTVRGAVDWLTVNGPDIYFISQGGDYIADIHMGWAQRFDAFHLIDVETGRFIVDERDNGTGDFSSIDEENKRVVIPESVMKTLGVGREYNVVVKYQNGGTGFLAGEKRILIQK